MERDQVLQMVQKRVETLERQTLAQQREILLAQLEAVLAGPDPPKNPLVVELVRVRMKRVEAGADITLLTKLPFEHPMSFKRLKISDVLTNFDLGYQRAALATLKAFS